LIYEVTRIFLDSSNISFKLLSNILSCIDALAASFIFFTVLFESSTGVDGLPSPPSFVFPPVFP
jgi:hypothetical protein